MPVARTDKRLSQMAHGACVLRQKDPAQRTGRQPAGAGIKNQVGAARERLGRSAFLTIDAQSVKNTDPAAL